MTKTAAVHERLSRREEIKGSSNRSFGLVFAAAFGLVGAWPLTGGGEVRWWAVGLAVAFLAVAAARPALLAPLNRLWTAFGLLLHKVVNPVVMGLLFYTTVTPIGVLMRLVGKNPLALRREPAAETYWRRREPPGPPPDSMRHQF